jgi:hypothetical protein
MAIRLSGASDRGAAHPSLQALPPNATPGKKWRFRRDLVIYISNRSGVSQRLLADVFDLPRSRISAIIKGFETRYGRASTED